MAGLGILDFLRGQNRGVGGGLLASDPAQPRPTPVRDWAGDRSNALLALGSGLLSQPTFAGGLSAGFGAVPQARQMDQQRGQQKALGAYFKDPANAKALTPGQLKLLQQYPQLAEKYLVSQFGPTTPTGQTDDIKEFEYAKKNGYTGTFTEFMNVKRTGSASTKTSLVPIWGEDAEGNSALVQPTDTGEAVQTKLPPGFKPSKGVDKLDAGDHWVLIDKQTGAVLGNQPKALAQAAADEKLGGSNAADLIEVNAGAKKAVSQKNTISVMRQLAADPKFYSGAFSDQIAGFKRIAIALGGDPEQVASMENFQSLSNELVRQRLGSLGTGVSNADVGFISRTVPTLDMSPGGIGSLMDILEKMADRDIEVANLAKDYAETKSRTKGALDSGWTTYLAKWAQANPLFGSGGGGSTVDDLIRKYAP